MVRPLGFDGDALVTGYNLLNAEHSPCAIRHWDSGENGWTERPSRLGSTRATWTSSCSWIDFRLEWCTGPRGRARPTGHRYRRVIISARPAPKALPKSVRSSLRKIAELKQGQDKKSRICPLPHGVEETVFTPLANLGYADKGLPPVGGYGEWIIPEAGSHPSKWEVFLRQITQMLVLCSSGQVEKQLGGTYDLIAKYRDTRWTSWVKLYAYYCGQMNLLTMGNFISPAALIVALRSDLEDGIKIPLYNAVKPIQMELQTSSCDRLKSGGLWFTTDMLLYCKSNTGACDYANDGLKDLAGWQFEHYTAPMELEERKDGELAYHLSTLRTTLRKRGSDKVNSVHIWVSMVEMGDSRQQVRQS